MGGIELHLRDLAIALRASGIDAEIVTTTRGDDEVSGVPVRRVRAALAPGSGFAFTPGGMQAVRSAIDAGRFDVVHAHASVVSPVAYVGALAGARAGLPAVITFHSMLHRSSFLLGASESMFGWAEGRVVLSAVSSVVADQAARWIPGASVGVLPNGVDATFWRGTSRTGLDSEVTFVSAMRLSRKKRPLELVRAFAAAVRFVAGEPAMRLVVAGDGPERGAMGRLAAELGVGDRVELPGQLSRDALRALYARAHAFVLPSERESFGIAALEARTAGLPVIGMLASGVRDFIRHGADGLLASDHDELARYMSRMALDAPFREYVMHRNSLSAPPYDWSTVAEMHRLIYDVASRARTR
jgi:glycosyltransferase involved in cell wall biosynthesis